jgi:hypothetical protein
MHANIGQTDWQIRIVSGVVLLLATLSFNLLPLYMALVGAGLLLSALFRTCPLYMVLGLDTRATKPEYTRPKAAPVPTAQLALPEDAADGTPLSGWADRLKLLMDEEDDDEAPMFHGDDISENGKLTPYGQTFLGNELSTVNRAIALLKQDLTELRSKLNGLAVHDDDYEAQNERFNNLQTELSAAEHYRELVQIRLSEEPAPSTAEAS